MLRGLIKGFSEIIWPKRCLVCKDSVKEKAYIDGYICAGCWGKIKRNIPPFCYRCGRRLDSRSFTKTVCPGCIKKSLYFDRAFSPCVYEGPIKELIHEFKYHNKEYLGATLSKLMIDFVREYNLPIDFVDSVIPIPLYKSRLREREFNQARILSDYVAREFGKPMLDGVLIRKRPTRTQTELEDNARFLNVKDSFALTREDATKNMNLLLVDDVLTTGATASEAARSLKSAGANIVFVLTLAN